MATKSYMIVIALGASKSYGPKVGWDDTFATHAEAEACAERARRNDGWSIKVVEVSS